jgi:hypothetical protein
MTNRNKAAGENLTKAHREVGIKAVAAAVKVNKQKGGSDEAQTDKQGEASMNEQSRQFAERTTKAASENLERGASAREDVTRNAEQSYSTALAGMRELNLKLIEMAQANTEAVFELAHQIASVEAPSDLTEISAEHTRRQFELMTKQSKELTNLGQKLAGRATEPLTRTVNEAFGRGT